MLHDQAIHVPWGLNRDHSVVLPSSAECLLVHPSLRLGHDGKKQVEQAFLCPQQFPALPKCLVPGDHIVIALDKALDDPMPLVVEVVAFLLEHGVEPAQVEVVFGDHSLRWRGSLEQALNERSLPQIPIGCFDPADQSQRSYLGADSHADPIYVCRKLVEADFVLPLVAMDPGMPSSAKDPFGVVPSFLDDSTQSRWRSRMIHSLFQKKPGRVTDHRDQIAELLGLQAVLAVVPEMGESHRRLFFGEVHRVRDQVERAWSSVWPMPSKLQYDLIVAWMESLAPSVGEESPCLWDDLAEVALRILPGIKASGTMVIGCEHLTRPAGCLRLLGELRDEAEAETQLRRRSNDPWSWPAAQLYALTRQRRLVVVSHLPSEPLEAMGLGASHSPDEISRLCRQSESCLMVDAARVRPWPWSMASHPRVEG